MELVCAVQNYAWGVKGKASKVAQLSQASQPSAAIDENKPYAELWMGTHPNGPSIIKSSGLALSSFIQENDSVLGKNITSKFGTRLPFLFKVLSVNQALSIQAHPEKTHAEQLHKDHPDIYKDPNHKPEMTIALTPFLALCGFRPAKEIITFFKAVPELVTVIGPTASELFIASPSSESLKACFSGLMRADKNVIESALNTFSTRIKSMDAAAKEEVLGSLFLTLLSQYPGDGGCFAPYILNLIKLEPGQAMFLGPNVIHAYLQGDCMECMACSDNVVRAGLTPKFQDVDTLLSMLEYEMSDANSRIFQSSTVDECTKLFNPPVPDFAVEATQVPESKTYSIRPQESCSIVLVVSGEATVESGLSCEAAPASLSPGSVLFLNADTSLTLTTAQQPLKLFRALCV